MKFLSKKILQIKLITKKMNEGENKKSSFVEHLTELRSRLVKSIIYLFIGEYVQEKNFKKNFQFVRFL